MPFERHSFISTPHTSTSLDPKHWTDPPKFLFLERYLGVPTSAQVDEAKARQIGFARCPFDPASFNVSDGRKAALTNSAFGTVFGVADGKAAVGLRLCGICSLRVRLPAVPG